MLLVMSFRLDLILWLINRSYYIFQWQVGISTRRACARDLFARQSLGMHNNSFTAKVNPSGVVMVKLTPFCEDKASDKKDNHKRCCLTSC